MAELAYSEILKFSVVYRQTYIRRANRDGLFHWRAQMEYHSTQPIDLYGQGEICR